MAFATELCGRAVVPEWWTHALGDKGGTRDEVKGGRSGQPSREQQCSFGRAASPERCPCQDFHLHPRCYYNSAAARC